MGEGSRGCVWKGVRWGLLGAMGGSGGCLGGGRLASLPSNQLGRGRFCDPPQTSRGGKFWGGGAVWIWQFFGGFWGFWGGVSLGQLGFFWGGVSDTHLGR